MKTLNLLIKPAKAVLGVFAFTTALFISSCGGPDQEIPEDIPSIKEKISEYNDEIVELNQKVRELENKLVELGETPRNRSKTNVEVFQLEPQTYNRYVKVNGTVEAVREAMVSPETNGQIKSISVKKGQTVSAGQELARLNTSVIENNIAEIKTSLSLAETVFKRQEKLWEQEIGSEIQYLEAKNNYETLQKRLSTLESQLEMAVIKAPFNGVVDEIFMKEGELAMPGMQVMQIINLSDLYVNAEVSESFLPVINATDKVILRFPSYPDYEEVVSVYRIGNVINPDNRTFPLQLRIKNVDQKIKPNMLANISIESYASEEALVLPSILIKQDVQGYFVYVADENNNNEKIAKKAYIERGYDGEGKTLVESGLNQGDLIINAGHNQVSEGSFINIKNTLSMNQPTD